MSAKVWYVAAGKKKAGPMTSGRLAKQVSLGKVPEEALAWKEGMEDWEPIHTIDRFAGSDEDAPTQVGPLDEAPKPKKKKRKPSSKSKVAVMEPLDEAVRAPKPAKKKTGKTPRPRTPTARGGDDLSFVPLYRLAWTDMFRAFGMGLEGQRLKLALPACLLPAAGVAVVLVMGLVAAKLHALLALPFALLAPIVGYVLTTVGVGAMSYYSRHQLQELERPGVKECLRYALQRASAMSLPPFVLALSPLVPLVALVILALLVKIPVVGPLGTGLLFGVHLALGISVTFLCIAAGLAGAFGPVVAAFEETGAKATMRVVLDFARRSLMRTVLWSMLPSLAMGPFAHVLLVLGVISISLPLAAVSATVGVDTVQWLASGAMGDSPHQMSLVMVLLIGVWVGLGLTAFGSVIVSVQNALCSLLYVGGRPGNDDMISRDTYLARRAGEEA